MIIAMTREVSPTLGKCELTHLERQVIDVDLARSQHYRYEDCLSALGCQLQRLPPEPDLPDAVFVEDTAVVLDELALITRPGAPSRQAEVVSTAKALAPYRKLCPIQAPGRLDGGDVLRVGKTLYVGLSSRSEQSAIDQMREFVSPHGYRVQGVRLQGCLHLKSGVTQVGHDMLLINRDWVDASAFEGLHLMDVHPSETHAANALLLGDTLVYPVSYPYTRQRLEQHGIKLMAVDLSELAKAEGAVTCCSLIFSA